MMTKSIESFINMRSLNEQWTFIEVEGQLDYHLLYQIIPSGSFSTCEQCRGNQWIEIQ